MTMQIVIYIIMYKIFDLLMLSYEESEAIMNF